jgi:hypothetical protein
LYQFQIDCINPLPGNLLPDNFVCDSYTLPPLTKAGSHYFGPDEPELTFAGSSSDNYTTILYVLINLGVYQ